MGADYSEFVRPCCHVWVLLLGSSRHQDLVEGMDHATSNHPIRSRPRLHLLCIVQLLRQQVFPKLAPLRLVRRRGLCCLHGLWNSEFLSRPFHLLLPGNVQERQDRLQEQKSWMSGTSER